MLHGIRRLIVVAALGTAVACGRAAEPGLMAIVTPAPIPITATSPDATPGAEPTPFTIPGVLACRAADLDVVVKVANPSYVGNGPMNTSSWDLTMTDVGSRPCFVGPTPDVSYFTSSGQISIPKGAPWSGVIVYLSPGKEPAPPYFGSATGEIDVDQCHLAQPLEYMLVNLGGTLGSVRVAPGPAAGWGASCPVGGENYFTELYGLPNDGSIGGYAPRTETTVTAPPSARPGERVNFTVTLVNQAVAGLGLGSPAINATWTFARCPMFYEEVEGVVGTFQTSPLDCANAEPIPAGGSEAFDMHIDIPADAEPGPATLIWSLVGSPALYQEGTSYLPIA
jgi:hypothetical protein